MSWQEEDSLETADEPDKRAKVPTIKDVARIAGASLGTVSKVINNDASVRAPLRSRVLRAIEDLKYQPNALAQGMRRTETGVVGCTISDISHPTVSTMVSAAEMLLSDAGFGMVLTSHRDQLRHERRLFDFLCQRRVDGLIGTVVYDDNQSPPDFLKRAEFPIVLMERQFGDLFDSVVSDQEHGCYGLTKHLIDLGHRRIAILTPPRLSRPGRDRIRAFIRAHEDGGLSTDPELIKDRENRADTGFRDAYAMLMKSHRPTALIASVNEIPSVIRAARMRGLSIPEDLSIASCGDSDFAPIITPAITCFRWDTAEVGRFAAEFLLSRIRDSRQETRQVILPTEIVLRDSCAPPRNL